MIGDLTLSSSLCHRLCKKQTKARLESPKAFTARYNSVEQHGVSFLELICY